MSSIVIVGTQWGDEGKGKIVDHLSERSDFIVRSQGGSNAGHTIVVDNVSYKLRLLPSGILYKDKICVIGNGVVINPKVFLEEIKDMADKGIDIANLRISSRAHILFPYHILLDEYQERMLGGNKIGTTNNGIGPCYMDKVSRMGIRAIDLINDEIFQKKLKSNVETKNVLIERVYNEAPLNYNDILNEYREYALKLKPYIVDTAYLINKALDSGKKVLFEGAQATMLDIDHGTYPFVTSSNPTAAGACTGSGVGPLKIDNVIGVVKAYSTRVGAGPFPTELDNEIGEYIRERAREYGTVTGRSRRCGWLDLSVVKYAGYINSLKYLAITRLDILDTLDTIKLCVGYKHNGVLIEEYPSSLEMLKEVTPIYEEFKGWNTNISEIREYDALPENARIYLKRIEEVTNVSIGIVSVGAAREATIICTNDLF